jgi:hypothetical protein
MSQLLHLSLSLSALGCSFVCPGHLRLQLPIQRFGRQRLILQKLLNCIQFTTPVAVGLGKLRLQFQQRFVAAFQLTLDKAASFLGSSQLTLGSIGSFLLLLKAPFKFRGLVGKGRYSSRVQLFHLKPRGRSLEAQQLGKFLHLPLERLR